MAVRLSSMNVGSSWLGDIGVLECNHTLCLFCIFLLVDLDHTADIQLHAWGENLRHAMENIVPCMFNYITDLSLVDIDEHQNVELIVKG
jgi:hypothetical protein